MQVAENRGGQAVCPNPDSPRSEYISVAGLKGQKFDHKRNIALMSPKERLEEYLFLQYGHGDEKDPMKGVTLSRLPHIHARIEELETCVLTGGCAYCRGESTAVC